VLDRGAHVLDACHHGRQRDELGVAGAGNQARERRLADEVVEDRGTQAIGQRPPSCGFAAAEIQLRLSHASTFTSQPPQTASASAVPSATPAAFAATS
jgi:hypothetical protein